MKQAVIDPTAEVHPEAHIGFAQIGARTRVWQFASVIRGAVVGEDCSIATQAIVDGSIMGHRCIVSHGAFVDPGMRIHDDVFIGPHVSLCNDFWPRTDKDGWFDMADLVSGKITVIEIASGASIGANAVVLPGITIGYGAMVAAGAVVTQDVPPLHLYRRDGSMTRIASTRPVNRMRTVCST